MKLPRRKLLLFSGGLLAASVAARMNCGKLARPSAPDGPLSDRAKQLIQRAWAGLDPARVLDIHVHVVGLGNGGSGCYVNPRMQRFLRHPIHYAKFAVYKTAAGVQTEEGGDAEYLARLTSLIRSQQPHGRLLILAFDQTHGEDGNPQRDESEFYTPNDYVLRLARENPDVFVPCASIHPYRKDAVAELERCVKEGAVAVKWLPNSQRMDPSSERCDPFYKKLAELKVPLLTHAGEEQAVEAGEAQRLGNPLHLRRPLSLGVKVIVAHCASLGTNPDLDSPETDKPLVHSWDLFSRLMDDPQWDGQLFGDISVMTQFNRLERPLRELLQKPAYHSRILNGSDYPLPAVNALMRTGPLEEYGFLTREERAALNEIDQHNPLLFDFVLKRTVKVTRDGKSYAFPAEAFVAKPGLFPGLG